MSLAAFLPPPRYASVEPDSPPASPPLLSSPAPTAPSSTALSASAAHAFVPPPYGRRQGFVPRTAADFGDGGAYPELGVLQYPLSMGLPRLAAASAAASSPSSSLSLILHSSSSSTTPVQYNSDGSVRYDAIVQQGRPAGVTVQSSYSDMVATQATDEQLARPSAEEEAKAVEETKKALGLAVEKRLAHSSTTYVKPHSREAAFVRYTPSASSVHHNSGASSRLIRLTEAPVDPLQPMLLKHQKLPAALPDAPVPLMHSPPRKLNAEDVAAWKIPPCISNWKNSKGYTIALDKRMASDGRGLQTVEVSDKFAKLSESLFVAERLAREEIEQRAQLMQGVRRKEKEEKEDELRRLAEEARRTVAVKQDDSEADERRDSEAYKAAGAGTIKTEHFGDGDDEAGRRERDEVRRDRQNELKRSMLQARQKETRGGKIASLRDDDRDISEKIALGQAAVSAASASSSSLPLDSRLFNQSEGLSAGFASDDTYSIYDKPLFQASGASGQYRPTAISVDDESRDELASVRGRADMPFKGTEGVSGGGRRVQPVEFEREDADPFGLGSLLNEASQSAEEERKERERDRYRDDGDDRHRSSEQRRQAGRPGWEEKEEKEEQYQRDGKGRGGYQDSNESQRDGRRRGRSRSGSPDRQRGRDRDNRDNKRGRY